MRAKRLRLPLLPVVVALLMGAMATACGGSSAPAAKPSTPSTTAKAAPTAPSKPAAPAPASSTAAAPAKLTPVTIAVPVASDAFAELYVARDLGIFKQHGLNVTIETMKMPTALAALTKGSVTFEAGSGSAVRAGEEGLPLKTIFIANPHPNFLIMSAKNITKVSQLKGKSIVMKTPTEAITAVGQAWLASKGLPASDYKYLQANGTPEEIALLSKGTVQAAVVELSAGLPLTKQGYHILGDTSSVTIPLSGLSTSAAQIKAHPQVMREAVAAAIQADGMIAKDEAQVLPVIEKDFHDSPAIAQQVYNVIKNQWSATGRPSTSTIQRGFQQDKVALAAAHAKAKYPYPFKASDFYDFQFLP